MDARVLLMVSGWEDAMTGLCGILEVFAISSSLSIVRALSTQLSLIHYGDGLMMKYGL